MDKNYLSSAPKLKSIKSPPPPSLFLSRRRTTKLSDVDSDGPAGGVGVTSRLFDGRGGIFGKNKKKWYSIAIKEVGI